MFFIIKESRLLKISLLLILLGILALGIGCAKAPTRGWSGPIVVNNILYVGTIEGKVIALNLSDGEPVEDWYKEIKTSGGGGFACGSQISKPMSTYGTPAIKDSVLYIGGYNGKVYGFDVDTPSRLPMEFSTGEAIVGSPVIDGDTLYVGSSNGNLYALYLDLREDVKWQFKTGGEIWSTPVVVDNVVYIGSSDHKFYAIDTESGNELWHFESDGAILSTALVSGDIIYIGSCDRKFYTIDKATEEERLGAAARAEGQKAPVKLEKQVFDGAGNWFWTQALSYEDKIYVGNFDGKLYVLDALDIRNKLDEFVTDGRVSTPPIVIQGKVVIGSQDGYIYIIDPQKDHNVVKNDPNPGTDPKAARPPILAPLWSDNEKGIVYAHGQNGVHMLYAIDVETGDLLWSYKTSE